MPDTRGPGDPSPRTIEQLYREVNHLKELMDTHFESNARAIVRLQEIADSQPTPGIVMAAVVSLKELTEAKIAAVEKLADAVAAGNKTALEAALLNRKEALDKIESSFTKRFEDMVTNFNTKSEGLEKQLTDIKLSVSKTEGRGTGRGDFIGWIVAGVAIVAGLITIFATRA